MTMKTPEELAAELLTRQLGEHGGACKIRLSERGRREWIFQMNVDGKPVDVAWRRELGYGLFKKKRRSGSERPVEIMPSPRQTARRILEMVA